MYKRTNRKITYLLYTYRDSKASITQINISLFLSKEKIAGHASRLTIRDLHWNGFLEKYLTSKLAMAIAKCQWAKQKLEDDRTRALQVLRTGALILLFVHWKCFVLWLAHTKSIVILPYIQVEILSPCFLHVHRLYDAAAPSPGLRLRSPGSLAIIKQKCL